MMYIRVFKHLSLFLALFIFTLFTGCARLPDYARPQFSSADDNAITNSNSFAYRQLKVEDFQATSLPATITQYNHRIQARSCISLRPSDGTVLRIVSGAVMEKPVYIGSFSEFTFEAAFNPDCSWWSPNVPEKSVSYVLQHEQIHFALAELSARKVNSESQQELGQYLAIGNNPEEVQLELVEKAKNVSREVMEQELDLHTAFDEETSLYYDPEVQQKWFEDVVQRLASSGGVD